MFDDFGPARVNKFAQSPPAHIEALVGAIKAYAKENGGRVLRSTRSEIAWSWPKNPAIREIVVDQLDRPKGRYYATNVDGVSGTGWLLPSPRKPEENFNFRRMSELDPSERSRQILMFFKNSVEPMAKRVTATPVTPTVDPVEELRMALSRWLKRKSDSPTDPARAMGKTLQGDYRDWNLAKNEWEEDDEWEDGPTQQVLDRATRALSKALAPYKDIIRDIELWRGDKDWVEVTVKLR